MIVVDYYDRKRKTNIGVLVIGDRQPAKREPGSLKGLVFDRVLMFCVDCRRHHYATVGACPPLDARQHTISGVLAVCEDAD